MIMYDPEERQIHWLDGNGKDCYTDFYCGEEITDISCPLMELHAGKISLQQAYIDITNWIKDNQQKLLIEQIGTVLQEEIRKGVLEANQSCNGLTGPG